MAYLCAQSGAFNRSSVCDKSGACSGRRWYHLGGRSKGGDVKEHFFYHNYHNDRDLLELYGQPSWHRYRDVRSFPS